MQDRLYWIVGVARRQTTLLATPGILLSAILAFFLTTVGTSAVELTVADPADLPSSISVERSGPQPPRALRSGTVDFAVRPIRHPGSEKSSERSIDPANPPEGTLAPHRALAVVQAPLREAALASGPDYRAYLAQAPPLPIR